MIGNNQCASCKESIGFLSNIFASKMIPIKCDKCGSSNFRSHFITYYYFSVACFFGLIALLIAFMTSGSKHLLSIFTSLAVIFFIIYFGEIYNKSLQNYQASQQEKDKAVGFKKAVVAIAIIFLSIGSYFYFEVI